MQYITSKLNHPSCNIHRIQGMVPYKDSQLAWRSSRKNFKDRSKQAKTGTGN